VVAIEPRILRLFTFRPVRVAFDRILREEMVPALLELPGLADVYVGRQGPDELGPRLVATVWASHDAMESAVGVSFERPVFLPEYLAETTDRELEFLPLAFGYRFQRPDRPGVLRLVAGQVRSGELERYVEEARAGTQSDAAAGHGPLALYLASRSPDEFVTLSVWPDWATLQDATGGDIDQPVATRHAQLLRAWRVDHYEAIPEASMPARPGEEVVSA
jgi:hypothetical protein